MKIARNRAGMNPFPDLCRNWLEHALPPLRRDSSHPYRGEASQGELKYWTNVRYGTLDGQTTGCFRLHREPSAGGWPRSIGAGNRGGLGACQSQRGAGPPSGTGAHKGWIATESDQARSMRLLGHHTKPVAGIPLLGSIPAGQGRPLQSLLVLRGFKIRRNGVANRAHLVFGGKSSSSSSSMVAIRALWARSNSSS